MLLIICMHGLLNICASVDKKKHNISFILINGSKYDCRQKAYMHQKYNKHLFHFLSHSDVKPSQKSQFGNNKVTRIMYLVISEVHN